MRYFNNLPLLEIVFDEIDSGLTFVSLVNKPAIKTNFLSFADEDICKFSIQDPDKRIVTGPAMIPNMPIYRRNEQGEFYVQFSEDTIKHYAEKFFAEKKTLAINVEHELSVEDCVFVESYFIDKERGIVPKEYNNLPNGTWILSAKINNEQVWQEIKNNNLKGWSIEGRFEIKSNFNEEQPELPELPPIDEIKEPTYKSVYDIIADTIFK